MKICNNANYTICFGENTFYVPIIKINSIIYRRKVSFLMLLKKLIEQKNDIEEFSQNAVDDFSSCVLIQLCINFDCEEFHVCSKCIFKPHIIKTIGIAKFFKCLALSKSCHRYKGKVLRLK